MESVGGGELEENWRISDIPHRIHSSFVQVKLFVLFFSLLFFFNIVEKVASEAASAFLYIS